MFKNLALLARDRPFYFFGVGYLVLAAQIVVAIAILAALFNSPLKPDGMWASLVVGIVFLPIFPVFFPLNLMFIEWYFNLLQIGWIVGLDQKPILRWFLRFAGVAENE